MRKIVQISYAESTESNDLYALDDAGVIWKYEPPKYTWRARTSDERAADEPNAHRNMREQTAPAEWVQLIGLPV